MLTAMRFRGASAVAVAAIVLAASAGAATEPGAVHASAVAGPNGIVVNGKPFFPLMVYRQCPTYYPQSLAAGINLFVGAGCGADRSFLDALGGRAYGLVDVVHRDVSGPGLIGFNQPDEADEHGGLDSLVPLPPSTRTGRVAMLTLTNHFFSGAAPLPQGRGMYPKMVKAADMVGFDLYPLAIWCRRAFLAVFDAQRELVRLAPGKPTFQWIEAGPMTGCSRFIPTPESLEAETWLAIAAGARGIGYFPDTWAPDIAKRIAEVNRRIAALAPVLLAPERPVSSLPNAVRAGARALAGATYVVAVNASSRLPANARITVPGLTAFSIRVYGEPRALPVRAGVFRDRLAPLQTRIYVAPRPAAP